MRAPTKADKDGIHRGSGYFTLLVSGNPRNDGFATKITPIIQDATQNPSIKRNGSFRKIAAATEVSAGPEKKIAVPSPKGILSRVKK